MGKMSPPFDVRSRDLEAFLAVAAHGSVTAAARSIGTTPSQVSKAVDRLERALKARLLVRTGRGVTLTRGAQRLRPLLEKAREALQRARGGGTALQRELTVAAPSYLLQAFLPACAAGLEETRVRGLQLAPSAIMAFMSLGHFEVALLAGEHRLPSHWRAERVGALASGLFAQPTVARRLGPSPTANALRGLPFIAPVAFTQGHFEPVDDGCPLPLGERLSGHEAPSIGLALAVAAKTPQLAFGPRIAARDAVAAGTLVEVPVAGWNVKSPLILAADIDRLTARDFARLCALAKSLVDTSD